MMFKRVFYHELKNITRDKMYLFFVIFSLIMAIVAYLLVPYLRDNNSILVANLMTILFILMNSFLYGAITGFTLLDDQDDNVLFSLRITPIKVRDYVLIKLSVSYLFGLVTTFLILLTSGLFATANIMNMIYVMILVPIQGPILALLINSFATNKVEGFVFMKLSGLILMAPIAGLFVFNWTEFLLGVLPGFWTVRILSMELLPTQTFILSSSFLYFVIGMVVNGAIAFILYRLYKNRVHI